MEEYKRGLEPTAADASISTASQNFERAREERAAWPEWKQEHTLTKHSGAVQIAHPAAFEESGTVTGRVSAGQPTPTMSSREIAELTGKEHKHVLFDIRKMLEELGKTSAEFSANLPDAYGRPQVVFNLPKDLTITLVSGYNVTMRHRIVTRWMELEELKVVTWKRQKV